MTASSDRYIIRPGRVSDTADIARLQAAVQLQAGTGGAPHPGIAAWAEDLLDGHPTVGPADFLVAEERATGRPVANLVGLRQDWSLAGVRLPVVQIELVGTAPEHRGNRLTDRLFAALHARYAAEAPLLVIEGIPYFYRRFGYDYGLATGGASTVPAAALPFDGQDRSGIANGDLTVRPATGADADALADIDRRLTGGDALTCPRDAAVWRYEIAGRRPADFIRRVVTVLTRGADIRGYLVHGPRLSATGELPVFAAACTRPVDWPAAAGAMHAYLGRVGRQYATSAAAPFVALRRVLDADHPLVRFGPLGLPRREDGWYTRTEDPVTLLARLQQLLRARWQAADLRWSEPTMTIDLYGRAAVLAFTDGELTAVTAVRGTVDPTTAPGTHAAVPPAALLALALGHRTVPEVLDAWPDCYLRDRLTGTFLTAAFPRVPVRVWLRN